MPTLEPESTLTDRYQTTVPETVRRALKLSKRDKIHYTIRLDGEVVLSRAAPPEDDDPVLGQFLHFLAQDMPSREGFFVPTVAETLGRAGRCAAQVLGMRTTMPAPCRWGTSLRKRTASSTPQRKG